MKKNISLSAVQARGIAFILLSAIFVACAIIAIVFLDRTKKVRAEEREDDSVYHSQHTDGEDEPDEDFFDVYAEYAEEIEAEQPVDAEDDDHHDHDETEEWQLCKVDTSTNTRAYKMRARLAARGASVKEDVVKRRRSCGCDGILI